MDIGETLYVHHRKPWREWLQANFETAKEIWLIYPNKASGEPRILYNDAVEEALCFGWIDSIIKKLDDLHAVQRFTPRRPRSSYSQLNKERLRWLAGEGLLHPSVRAAVSDILDEEFVFPLDILQAIRANERAWRNFQGFSPAYQRIRVAYIDIARRRPEVYESRLKSFVAATENGRQIGYGGIDKYY
ncbi:MAG: YdeI/OmpD-associated family protein [bacterium]|nr:YdeI/OmpD-associated family protein [bacterium]MCY3785710.1 YdeI/OmpD-associated family protein [bacterium]MXV91208.1 hypothetical protein [Acidimicrobiia bacterium]MYC45282.1 hypothetical protein [Acidimicrobiia bacterium]MYI20427.1 hypothetical protein [Acidimicrobiia bacterium]